MALLFARAPLIAGVEIARRALPGVDERWQRFALGRWERWYTWQSGGKAATLMRQFRCGASGERVMGVRAGILVVTGTEVLTGRVADRNGPWVADRLLELGVELAHITIRGDRPADIGAQVRFLRDGDVDLIVTTGGLGLTADDMTVATVAGFFGRDPWLIPRWRPGRAIVQKWMSRFSDGPGRRAGRQPKTGHGAREGAVTLDPVGTARAWWCPGRPTVVRPARRRKLQAMWPAAVATDGCNRPLLRCAPITGRRPYGCSGWPSPDADTPRRRGAGSGLRCSLRSPPACAGAKWRW